MRILSLLALVLSFSAEADQFFVGYGGDDKAKIFNLGIREDVMSDGYIQAKTGYYGDFYIAAGGGVIFDFEPVEARAGLSLAAMSRNTLFGLNGEVYFGVRDRRSNGIGLQYENLGNHNFISIQVSTEF